MYIDFRQFYNNISRTIDYTIKKKIMKKAGTTFFKLHLHAIYPHRFEKHKRLVIIF